MNMLVYVNDKQLGVEVRSGITASQSSSNASVQHAIVPENPTLVLIHGFTGSAASWGRHLDNFAAYGFNVIALDMPGHGTSDAPADPQHYTIEQSQEDILGVLDTLGVPKGTAFLLGYSMGGRIALFTAFSDYFRALILESASPGLASAKEREERRKSDEALAQRIEQEGIAAFVDYWEKLPLFISQRSLSPEIQQALHTQRLLNRTTGLAQSLRGVGTGAQPSLHSRLPTLQLPVLLIAGELDSKFCTIAQEMATLLPRSQLCIVQGAGHCVHLEQPEQFQQLVRDFIISLV